jgi:hypothetical protein
MPPVHTSSLHIPFLDPTVVQAEATAVVAILTPIVAWLPGSTGNTILAVLKAIVSNTTLLTDICNLINSFSGATPPVTGTPPVITGP